jgi:hypothetical protein
MAPRWWQRAEEAATKAAGEATVEPPPVEGDHERGWMNTIGRGFSFPA